jgi:hypothetical protein
MDGVHAQAAHGLQFLDAAGAVEQSAGQFGHAERAEPHGFSQVISGLHGEKEEMFPSFSTFLWVS